MSHRLWHILYESTYLNSFCNFIKSPNAVQLIGNAPWMFSNCQPAESIKNRKILTFQKSTKFWKIWTLPRKVPMTTYAHGQKLSTREILLGLVLFLQIFILKNNCILKKNVDGNLFLIGKICLTFCFENINL